MRKLDKQIKAVAKRRFREEYYRKFVYSFEGPVNLGFDRTLGFADNLADFGNFFLFEKTQSYDGLINRRQLLNIPVKSSEFFPAL